MIALNTRQEFHLLIRRAPISTRVWFRFQKDLHGRDAVVYVSRADAVPRAQRLSRLTDRHISAVNQILTSHWRLHALT